MTYHAPELHLVGAAQNLVHGQSVHPHKEVGFCDTRDNVPPEMWPYGESDTW
jgi:hypothetical protein